MDHSENDDQEVEPVIKGVDQTPADIIIEAFKGLGARIDKLSGHSGVLEPEEVREWRELRPKLRALVESRERRKWLLKQIGVFLLAAPAVGVILQGILKLLEWIKSQ